MKLQATSQAKVDAVVERMKRLVDLTGATPTQAELNEATLIVCEQFSVPAEDQKFVVRTVECHIPFHMEMGTLIKG